MQSLLSNNEILFLQINRNNNNNTITANHNHSHMHIPSLTFAHKPVITTLKPVEEAEGPYMKMDGTIEDWTHSEVSLKQVSSPIQEDTYQTNGPPGISPQIFITEKSFT